MRGPAAVALDHDQPAVDLLPPVHPRGILLADEAALGEADAVQLGRIAFEPEDVAELGAAFADAEAQAMLEPAGGGLVRRAPSQRRPSAGSRGSGDALARRPSTNAPPATASRSIADRAAQAVDRQALDQIVGGLGFAVEQQVVAVGPDDEIEQAFALRRQQPGPDRQRARDVVGHQALEEAAHVLAGQADDGAVGEGGRGHGPQLGSRPWHRKR